MKKYKGLQPKDRKCFGTIEYQKKDSICTNCKFYEDCGIESKKRAKKELMKKLLDMG